VCLKERKAYQGERRLRRAEKDETARPAKGEVQQEEWKRSSWEVLRKRAKWYYGPTVPQDVELWELEWCGQGAVVTYLKCSRCSKEGCHVEDDREQEVVPYWKGEKMNWCGCKEVKRESGTAQRGKGAAREGGSQKEVRRTLKMLREV